MVRQKYTFEKCAALTDVHPLTSHNECWRRGNWFRLLEKREQ